MTKRGLLKHFHLAVEAVNARLVEEFETGSDPADVAALCDKLDLQVEQGSEGIETKYRWTISSFDSVFFSKFW